MPPHQSVKSLNLVILSQLNSVMAAFRVGDNATAWVEAVIDIVIFAAS